MNLVATGMALLAVVGAAIPTLHLVRNRREPGAIYILALCIVCAVYPLNVIFLDGEAAVLHRWSTVTLVAPLYLLAVFAYLRRKGGAWPTVRVCLYAYMPVAALLPWVMGDLYLDYAEAQPYARHDHYLYTLGPVAWAMKIFSYCCIVIACHAVMRRFNASRSSQAHVLSLALFPMCAGFFDLLATLTGFTPYFGVTTVQLGLTAGLFALAYALLKHQLLVRVPVSRNTLMRYLREGVCVIGEQGEVVDCNDALTAIVGISSEKLVGRTANHVLPEALLAQLDVFRRHGHSESLTDVAVQLQDGGKHVNVSVSRIENSRAILLSVSDITDRHQQLIDAASSAGELRDMNEQLEELSLTDPLTGLGNRRALQVALAEQQDQEDAGALGLIMVDIDHFKLINDTHGHEAGDMVLVRLSAAMLETCRDNDIIVRWGGEEFVVLVSDADERRLQLAAERLRMHIRRLVIELPNGVALQITASIGATVMRPGQSSESALRKVDRLMYEAKQDGRDRVRSGRTLDA